MVVCPTLVVFKHGAYLDEILRGDYPIMKYVSPNVKSIWQMWESSKQNPENFDKIISSMMLYLNKLYQLDFRLLIGTELLFPGVVAGYALHEELAIWQEAGIAPVDILKSATIYSAEFLGLEKLFGSVEKGKLASLVLVKANPFEDIRN
jgi:hypothetical protein